MTCERLLAFFWLERLVKLEDVKAFASGRSEVENMLGSFYTVAETSRSNVFANAVDQGLAHSTLEKDIAELRHYARAGCLELGCNHSTKP